MTTPIPTRVEVTLPVPPGTTETDHRDVEIAIVEVQHRAYTYRGEFYRFVTVYDAEGHNTTFYPGDERAARYPHPGLWFDAIADEIRASVGGAS